MTKTIANNANHRLAWLDQLAYELFRVTGRSQLMQCLWLYDREVNLEALAQTNERLSALAFNRLIEPSPLPWGRPRWVKPARLHLPLETSPEILPRSHLLHWANQLARTPIDPVTGPAWRMAIQRFDDGSTAVSTVGSHLIIDGMGAVNAIAAAANGLLIPSTYLPQGTRGWLSASLSDARQILKDAPSTLAALRKLVQAKFRQPKETKQPTAKTVADEAYDRSQMVELPAVAVTIASEVWDACAQRLGGQTNTLLPGFVACLASHMGRHGSADGTITLLVPIDRRRGLDDERALAIEFRSMNVVPSGLASNLHPLNAQLKGLLRGTNKSKGNALASLFPAISWMPRTVATALLNQMFTYDKEPPVSCSNLGTLPEGLARIDGAPCGRVLTRAVDVNVMRKDLERSHGHLVVVASRHDKTVSLCIEACQLAPAPTTTEKLRHEVARTLADFELDAIIDA